MTPTGVRAVIFDISGTVLDYGSRGPVVAIAELFRRHGVEVSEEEVRRPMGLHKKTHIQAVLSAPEVSARWAQAAGGPPAAADLEGLYAEFQPLQIEVLREHSDLIPGVLEVTHELRARGIRFASTTSFDSNLIAELKPLAEAAGYKPDAWVCPDLVGGRGRPAPWMAFQAARAMEVYPMSRIVKVGDTLADIDEAEAAGMWAVAVVRHGYEVGLPQHILSALPRSESAARLTHARERLAVKKPHFIIDSTADLMPIIDEISWRLSRGEQP